MHVCVYRIRRIDRHRLAIRCPDPLRDPGGHVSARRAVGHHGRHVGAMLRNKM